MKIALVHDYLKEYGGAEKVLVALHEIWPEAPIYVIFARVSQNPLLAEKFKNAKIVQSWFGRLPLADKLMSPLRFLIPLVWGSLNLKNYDLVISSASWAVTKGLASGRAKEICYCHTPPRYLYGYETSRDWQKHWYIRLYTLIVNHVMRLYDFRQAQKVTWFIANSREVQARIQKFYRRESVVINPPVDTSEVSADFTSEVKGYFLTGGRLEKSKNFDLIIKVCNQLKLPLKIYGAGTQLEYLRSQAGSTIEFMGAVNDSERQKLMAECQAFIVAATDEDFGITPVETMAAGRPVIAFRGGGYLETVVEGKTGEFFDSSTVASLAAKLKNFAPARYNREACLAQAQKFSQERFISEIKKFVRENYARTPRSRDYQITAKSGFERLGRPQNPDFKPEEFYRQG